MANSYSHQDANNYSLAGRIAVVTGASRGIGAATALRLASLGAKVVVHYSKSQHPAEEVAAKIRAAGGEARLIQADLAKAAAIKPFFAAAVAAFGTLDIIVNNAGYFKTQPIQDIIGLDLYETTFDLNVRAPLLITSEAARYFLEHKTGHGRIINLSSIAAAGNSRASSIYSASKAALEAMTRGHANDLGPYGVTVNAVAPGVTETDMARDGLAPQVIASSINSTPLGRIGEPEDIADVVAFLASDAARWVTGQTITVSGGLRR